MFRDSNLTQIIVVQDRRGVQRLGRFQSYRCSQRALSGTCGSCRLGRLQAGSTRLAVLTRHCRWPSGRLYPRFDVCTGAVGIEDAYESVTHILPHSCDVKTVLECLIGFGQRLGLRLGWGLLEAFCIVFAVFAVECSVCRAKASKAGSALGVHGS